MYHASITKHSCTKLSLSVSYVKQYQKRILHPINNVRGLAAKIIQTLVMVRCVSEIISKLGICDQNLASYIVCFLLLLLLPFLFIARWLTNIKV